METDALTLEEKKRYAQEIIEGKMKLVGVNMLSLEEDNKDIRPLVEKIKEYRKKDIIRDIKDDITLYPLSYIDLYASEKTLRLEDLEEEFSKYKRQKGFIGANEDIVIEFLYASYNDLTGKFTDNESEKNILKRGAYLMDPELVYKIFKKPLSKVEEDEKYKKLYEYLKKEEQTKEVVKRQKLYEAYLKEKKEPEVKYQKEESQADRRNRIRKLVDNLGKRIEPDDFKSEYGLISRSGEYYSCGFAEHEVKAMQIIVGNPEAFGIKKDDKKIKEHDLSENWLDILYEEGWILIRNPYAGSSPYIDMAKGKRATKAQIDTVFDYMARFNRSRIGGLEDIMED